MVRGCCIHVSFYSISKLVSQKMYTRFTPSPIHTTPISLLSSLVLRIQSFALHPHHRFYLHTHLKNVEMLHTFTKRCSNATVSLIQPPKINPNISQHCGSPVASVVCDERLLFNESHRETARIRSSRRKGESKQNLKMSMGQSV